MEKEIIRYLSIFLIGFLSCAVILSASSLNFEKPFNLNFTEENSAKAPSDWIKQNQIEINDNEVVLNIKDASISKYAATGSMNPVFDENANGIRIVPKNEEEISVGDIISFKSGNDLIVHRVVEKGADENGTYFITKGDSNNLTDGKIRFSDIKYVTVGVIW